MILNCTKFKKSALIIGDNWDGSGFGYQLLSICIPNEGEKGERTAGKVLHANKGITPLNNRITEKSYGEGKEKYWGSENEKEWKIHVRTCKNIEKFLWVI